MEGWASRAAQGGVWYPYSCEILVLGLEGFIGAKVKDNGISKLSPVLSLSEGIGCLGSWLTVITRNGRVKWNVLLYYVLLVVPHSHSNQCRWWLSFRDLCWRSSETLWAILVCNIRVGPKSRCFRIGTQHGQAIRWGSGWNYWCWIHRGGRKHFFLLCTFPSCALWSKHRLCTFTVYILSQVTSISVSWAWRASPNSPSLRDGRQIAFFLGGATMTSVSWTWHPSPNSPSLRDGRQIAFFWEAQPLLLCLGHGSQVQTPRALCSSSDWWTDSWLLSCGAQCCGAQLGGQEEWRAQIAFAIWRARWTRRGQLNNNAVVKDGGLSSWKLFCRMQQ